VNRRAEREMIAIEAFLMGYSDRAKNEKGVDLSPTQ
jgi:hypothetical protein